MGMPEILPLGWFHTIVGICAIFAGIYEFAKYKVVSSYRRSGQIFMVCTFVAAVTALMIFQRGEFGPAHVLAVVALLSVFGGMLIERTALFGKFQPYLQAGAYTLMMLTHMLPAITDGLMRLPVGDPVVTNFEDPLLQGFIRSFLLLYVAGVLLQWWWLSKQSDQV